LATTTGWFSAKLFRTVGALAPAEAGFIFNSPF
jgi:hypothetical protein